jgi:Fibronectin type III domain
MKLQLRVCLTALLSLVLLPGAALPQSVNAVSLPHPVRHKAQHVAGQVPSRISDLTTPVDNFGDPDLFDDRITVVWTPPSSGVQITGYLLSHTTDLNHWPDAIALGPDTLTSTLSGLQPAQAMYFRVAALSAFGQGEWSEPYLASTSGFASTRVTVTDFTGLPITGGAITWSMDDGSARSVVTYGLTADGIIQFPGAPAGSVKISLRNGQMQDGTYVSGVWHAILGLSETVLTVPAPPLVSKHTIHVVLGAGIPLANVAISFSDVSDLSEEVASGGFSYKLPGSSSLSGLTNVNGDYILWGFTRTEPRVTANYDDGVIAQTKSGNTTGSLTTIKLRSLPFATFDSGSVQGSLGVPIPVVVSAGFGSGSSLRGLRAVGSGRRGVTVSSGVQVTLVGPAGAKLTSCSSSKVKPILSAKTDASGKAKLLVCPTRSGVYTLRTKGALSVGSVNVLVKGAAPFAVNSVTVRCPVPGVVHASWNKPIFDGGMPVTKYVVTLSAPGQKTVTKTLLAKLDVKGKVLKAPPTVLDVSGLANATTYKAQITAVTVNGMSDAYTTTIPVA